MGDSPLSITGSIVGIAALLLSTSTLAQGLFTVLKCYHSAPLEVRKIFSTINDFETELELGLQLHYGTTRKASYILKDLREVMGNLSQSLNDMLVEREPPRLGWKSRWLWAFRRREIQEMFARVETLRMRAMAFQMTDICM